MPWPEGSEDDLWDLASAWESFGGDLDTLAAGLTAEANNFAQAIQGQAGDKLNTLLAVDMHNSAVQLKDQADAYAKMLRNAGADIQKTKIMIIGMLAILAATIASLIASLFGSFAVPAVVAAARVGIGQLLKSLLVRLMQQGLIKLARELATKAFIGGVVGAGFMVGFDSAIQGVQIAQGHRDGFDKEALKGDAIGGAIGGALGGLAEGIAGSLGKIGRDIWERLPKSVRGFAPLGNTMFQIPAAALSNPIINKATHSPGNALDGVFGALDTGGGGHAKARVPHVDMPDIKPIESIAPLTPTVAPGTGQGTPVVAPGGTNVGTVFTQPVAPRASTPSWLAPGEPVRQGQMNSDDAQGSSQSGRTTPAPQVSTQGGPGTRTNTGTSGPQTTSGDTGAGQSSRQENRTAAPQTEGTGGQGSGDRGTTSGTAGGRGEGTRTATAGTGGGRSGETTQSSTTGTGGGRSGESLPSSTAGSGDGRGETPQSSTAASDGGRNGESSPSSTASNAGGRGGVPETQSGSPSSTTGGRSGEAPQSSTGGTGGGRGGAPQTQGGSPSAATGGRGGEGAQSSTTGTGGPGGGRNGESSPSSTASNAGGRGGVPETQSGSPSSTTGGRGGETTQSSTTGPGGGRNSETSQSSTANTAGDRGRAPETQTGPSSTSSGHRESGSAGPGTPARDQNTGTAGPTAPADGRQGQTGTAGTGQQRTLTGHAPESSTANAQSERGTSQAPGRGADQSQHPVTETGGGPATQTTPGERTAGGPQTSADRGPADSGQSGERGTPQPQTPGWGQGEPQQVTTTGGRGPADQTVQNETGSGTGRGADQAQGTTQGNEGTRPSDSGAPNASAPTGTHGADQTAPGGKPTTETGGGHSSLPGGKQSEPQATSEGGHGHREQTALADTGTGPKDGRSDAGDGTGQGTGGHERQESGGQQVTGRTAGDQATPGRGADGREGAGTRVPDNTAKTGGPADPGPSSRGDEPRVVADGGRTGDGAKTGQPRVATEDTTVSADPKRSTDATPQNRERPVTVDSGRTEQVMSADTKRGNESTVGTEPGSPTTTEGTAADKPSTSGVADRPATSEVPGRNPETSGPTTDAGRGADGTVSGDTTTAGRGVDGTVSNDASTTGRGPGDTAADGTKTDAGVLLQPGRGPEPAPANGEQPRPGPQPSQPTSSTTGAKPDQPVARGEAGTRPVATTGGHETRADGRRPVVEQTPATQAKGGTEQASGTTPATQSRSGSEQKLSVESPSTAAAKAAAPRKDTSSSGPDGNTAPVPVQTPAGPPDGRRPAEDTRRKGKEPMEEPDDRPAEAPASARGADDSTGSQDAAHHAENSERLPDAARDTDSSEWFNRRPDEGPADPVDRVDQARIERPKVAGDIDGTAVRQAILDLLKLKDSRTDRVLRAMVEQQFSDANLKEKFHRTLDGGLVVDLGPRPHGAPQVRIEVMGLGAPRSSRSASVDFTSQHSREPSDTGLSNARAAFGTDPRLFRVPTAHVYPQIKIAGLMNTRGSDLKSKLTHQGATKVTEPGVRAEHSVHDVSYKVSVRKPRSWPWRKGTTVNDFAWLEVPLEWSRREASPSTVDEAARPVPPKEIVHSELTGLGDIYHHVESSLGGFPVGHPGARKFRDWLHTLPASAPKLFSGEPVRRSFKFPGMDRVEVSVSVADPVVTRSLEATDGSIVQSRETAVEHSAGQSLGRRWGAHVTVMAGDLTGTSGWAVGPAVLGYGSTKVETRATEKFKHQLADKYEGPVGKQQLRFSYVVQYKPDHVVKVDGTATVWTKPDTAAEAVLPSTVAEPEVPGRPAAEPTLPSKVDTSRMLDQLDADHRLPEETLAHLVGPVLHRLSSEGVVPARKLPEIEQRFRQFLQDQARELVRGGDGVRFPLSSWQHNAPDVFVRGSTQVDKASYVGIVDRETRSGTTASGHTDTAEVTKGKDRQLGIATTLYDADKSHKDYRQMGSTLSYKTNRRSIENVEHALGAERPLAGDGPLHKVRYPVEFEVRIGGRWGDPAEKLYWRGDTAADKVPVYSGDVDVVAPERAAEPVVTRDLPEQGSPVWHDSDSSTVEGGRTGHLPPGFQLESLKPVPDLLGTVTKMIDAPPTSRYVGWIRRPLVGSSPARFDEHKGLGTWGREPDAPDERNAARDVLEGFASLPARAGGFERAALHQDTVWLKSHNKSGLVGNRERVARVDLSTQLQNARIIGVDEAHKFVSTEVTGAEWKSEVVKGKGIKLKADLVDILPFGKVASPFVMAAGAVMRVWKDGTSSGEGVKETVTRSHTERGYLVSYDATYDVRTSMRRNWHDFLGFRHDGKAQEAAKRVHVPEAATVWVPASEIHRIGDLLEDDLVKLDSGDARRYRQEHTTETAEPAGSAVRDTEEPPPPPEPDPVSAPSNVGRGSGRVELHRPEAGAELLTQIATRLDDWAAKHEGNPQPSIVDLTREAFGFGVPERPARRMAEFGPINERLVRDVLGPSLTGAEFTPTLKEMLGGGHPLYLEGATPYGKVEQLVVLRAELGDGAYRRTVLGEEIRGETTRVERTGSTSVRGWWTDWTAGFFSNAGAKHRPASSHGIAWSGAHKFEQRTELSHERGETITSSRSGDSAEFLHDLRVTMDVYPYSRASHYTKFLPGTRRMEEPWTTEFTLPGAVRSSVPLDETIPAGGRPEPALVEATGSLHEAQRELGLTRGIPDDTVVQVRPFDAPELHRSLDGLMRGDDSGRPLLHPRAIHQLQSATGSLPLRAHLRDLLSDDGYVVKVAGDALHHVKITADVVKRELVRVFDKPLESATTEKETAKRTDAHFGEMAPETYGNIAGPHVDNSTQRPGALVGDGYTPWKDWGRSRDVGTSTSREVKDKDGIPPADPEGTPKKAEEKRYLVRLTPEWTLEPAYRSSRAPSAWHEAVRTEPDTPILIETDRAGLKALGLSDPREDALAAVGDPDLRSRPDVEGAPSRITPTGEPVTPRQNISLEDFLGPRTEEPTTVRPEHTPDGDDVRVAEDADVREPEIVRESDEVRQGDGDGARESEIQEVDEGRHGDEDIDDTNADDADFAAMTQRVFGRADAGWPAWRTLDTIAEVDESSFGGTTSRPALSDRIGLPGGVDETGKYRWIKPDEVRVAPLMHGSRQIGVNFHTGKEKPHAQRWAEESSRGKETTYSHPESAEGASRFPSRKGAEEMRAPWRDNSVFIAAPGRADSFEVRLTDGSRVRLDGPNFARLVSGLDEFKRAVGDDEAGSLVLMSGRTGERASQGGAAHDFGRTLADEFGHRRPIVAPTTDVHLRTPLLGRGGQTVLDRGGRWRAFPVADVVQDVPLRGVDKATGREVDFHSSQVWVHSMQKADGTSAGVSFHTGTHLADDLAKGTQAPLGITNRFPEGVHRMSDVVQAYTDGNFEALRSPWPENTYLVTTHGAPGHFSLDTVDGRSLQVSGETFGRLLNDLRPFRDAMDRGESEAVFLNVCWVAATDGPGGPAHDFQRTLASEFGHRQPVVASTNKANFFTTADGRAWGVSLGDGGTLRTFSSGTAKLLGEDLNRPGQWTSFSRDDVVATPVLRDGRNVGVSFRNEAGRADDIDGVDRTTFVDAEQLPDGRYVVSTEDGRTLAVDGDTFGKVVAGSPEFSRTVAAEPPATLAVPSAGPGHHHTTDFMRTLEQQFPISREEGTAPVTALSESRAWESFPIARTARPSLGTLLSMPGYESKAFGEHHAPAVPAAAEGRAEPISVKPLPDQLSTVLAKGKYQVRSLLGLGKVTADVIQGITLIGIDKKTNGPIAFDSSQVRVHRMHRGGEVVGVSFSRGVELWQDRHAVGHRSGMQRAKFLPEGYQITDWKKANEEQVVRSGHAPWPANTFYVTTHGSPGTFLVRLDNGKTVTVGGEAFGRLLDDLRYFRDPVSANMPEALALIVCSVGREDAPGGGAHDLQRALEQLGYRQPVLASTTSMGFLRRGGTFIENGGIWRTIASGSAWVLGEDRGRPGNWSAFGVDQLHAVPLVRDGKTIGVSFQHGPRLDHGLEWAATGAKAAGEAPWPHQTFFVDASSWPDGRVAVHTLDGRRLLVDPGAFGRVVAQSRVFQDAMAGPGRPQALTLLGSEAGNLLEDGRNGARDFTRTLEREFGTRRPVYAQTGNVELRPDGRGQLVLHSEGGRWAMHANGPAPLRAVDSTGLRHLFEPSDVQVTALHHNGKPVGLSFHDAGKQGFIQNWVEGSGASRQEGAPWEDDAFFIAAPAAPGAFGVWLEDGHQLWVDGETFAELVVSVRPFRDAMNFEIGRLGQTGSDQVSGITLLASSSGTLAAAGGAAHDFQKSMRDHFGYGHPVYAPSTHVGLWTAADGGGVATRLSDGGEWRSFPVGPPLLTGQNARTGTRVWIPQNEVMVTPLTHGGQVIGMSFALDPRRVGEWMEGEGREVTHLLDEDQLDLTDARDAGAVTTGRAPWSERTFHVDAPAGSGQVMILAGADYAYVDAPTFAAIVARSEPFMRAVAAGQADSVSLLISNAAEEYGNGIFAETFQRTLAEQFSYRQPVHAPTNWLELEVEDGTSTMTLVDGGTWSTFPAGTPTPSERVDLTGDRSPEPDEIQPAEHESGQIQPIGPSDSLAPAELPIPVAERGPVVRPGPGASMVRSLRGLFGRPETLVSGLDTSGEVRSFRPRDVEVRPLVSDGRRVGASFRGGDEPVALPVSGKQPVFHIDVDAGGTRFGLRLSDGTPVSVDGRTFAEVVAKAKPFRSAMKNFESAAVALPGSRAGALTRIGGAAGDFQRGLAEFGHRTPVVAEDGAGQWRVFSDAPGPIAGTGEAGRVLLFGPEEVRAGAVLDGDAVVGVSFEGELSGVRGLPEPDGLPVAATGHADRFEVTLNDGRKVALSGDRFAELVSRTALFGEALANRTGAVTLLASRAGERLWAGGAAFDFQRALTERTGTEVSVLAPGDELSVSGFLSDQDSDQEVYWQTFSSRPVTATVPALNAGNWAAIGLDPAEVRADPLVQDGRVVGISFHGSETEKAGDLEWGAAGGKDKTYSLPTRYENLAEAEEAGLAPAPLPSPWPENTFHLVLHTFTAPTGLSYKVTMKDGTEAMVAGSAFADLVQRLEPFRSRMLGEDAPEAIALVSCFTAATEAGGQPAFDFQRAMASTFGHRQPVIGATEAVTPVIQGGRAVTTVSNAGVWRVLGSKGSDVLGTDATGRLQAFAPEDVRSRAIMDGGSSIGVSFRDGGWSGPEPSRWPEGAVGADVRVSGDKFVVTLADGRELSVDGRNFAGVLAASPAYRALVQDMPTALVLSSDAGKAAGEFQGALARTFFRGEPVLTHGDGGWKAFSPEPAVLPGTDTEGRVVLFGAEEVTFQPSVVDGRTVGVSFTGTEPPHGMGEDFRIAVDGDEHSFRLRLLDGTEATVSGGVLADVLDQTRTLWPIDPGTGPERVTLLGSAAGELDAPGGAAHDFQRALERRFGAWQPLSASTADGGQRIFSTLPRPLRGTEFSFAEARMRETFFQPGTVDLAPLRHGDRIVGVTFRTGTDRLLAQSWTSADGGSGTTHLLGARQYDLELATEDGQLRSVPAPWGDSAFHVDAEETGRTRIRIQDRDGRVLSIDGETLAELVTSTEPFRQAFEGAAPRAITLLVSKSGATVAPSFHHALAERFGRTEPVYAPTKDVELNVSADDGSSSTVVFDGGRWRRFDGTESEPVSPTGHEYGEPGGQSPDSGSGRFDETVPRGPAASPARDGERVDLDDGWESDAAQDSPGARSDVGDLADLDDFDRYSERSGTESAPPSPPRSTAPITLADFLSGTARDGDDGVSVTGDGSSPHRNDADSDGGSPADPRLAAWFEQADRRAERGPAETRMSGVVATGDWAQPSADGTSLRMTDPPAPSGSRPPATRITLVGAGAGGRRVRFAIGDVDVTTLEHNGRPIGVTFTTGESRDFLRRWAGLSEGRNTTGIVPRGHDSYASARDAGVLRERRSPWPDNAFYLNMHALVNDRGMPSTFGIELRDGTRVLVSGRVLAWVAGQLDAFRAAVRDFRPEAFVLLSCASGAIADGPAHTFQRAMAETFGYDRPVVAPTTSMDVVITDPHKATTAVLAGGTWRTFWQGPSPVVAADEANRAFYVRPADIVARPMLDGDRLVGISYRAGEETGALDGGPGTFFVAAEGRPDAFGVRHASGRQLFLDGADFAGLVSASQPFQHAMRTARPGSLALLAAGTGAVDRPSAPARAFQQALAETVGYQGRILAPRGGLVEGQWRAFGPDDAPSPSGERPGSSPQPAGSVEAHRFGPGEPVADAQLPVGFDAAGAPRRFEPGEVRVTPLVKSGQEIGLSFFDGKELAHSVRWGHESRSRKMVTYVHPEGGEGRSRFPGREGAQRMSSPWRDDAVFMAVPGDTRGFEVTLADGARLKVDGSNFAKLASGLDAFRRVFGADTPGSLVLLSGRTGEMTAQGGAAHDFQRGLAEAGYGQSVVAPTAEVHLRTPRVGRGGQTVLGRGGQWQVFHDVTRVADEPSIDQRLTAWFDRADRQAEAADPAAVETPHPPAGAERETGDAVPVAERETGDAVPVAERGPVARPGRWSSVVQPLGRWFGRSEVRLTGTDATGAVRSFAARDVVVRPLVADGHRVGMSFRSGDTVVETPVSSSRRPVFHLDVDAGMTTFGIRLSDGSQVSVDGQTFARVVAEAQPFRAVTRKHSLAGLALPGSTAGALTRPGGAARDFQQAMAQIGRRQPVAATDAAGRWRVFGDESRPIAGPVGSGRVHLFSAGEVQVTPVRDGDAVVGMSFRGELPDGVRDVPVNAVPIAVESGPDGFEVTLRNGLRAVVAPEGFADLVAGTGLFEQARRNRSGPVTLLASRADEVSEPTTTQDFRQALTQRFWRTEPPYVPAGDLVPETSADGESPVANVTDEGHGENSVPVEPVREPVPVPEVRRSTGRPVAQPPAAGRIQLLGRARGEQIRFSVDKVDFAPLEYNGKAIGVTFTTGEGRDVARAWAALPGSRDRTALLFPGHVDYDAARGAGAIIDRRAPWPDNVFYINSHATFARGQAVPKNFEVSLKDGTAVSVNGRVMAFIAAQLPVFREAIQVQKPEGIVLLACAAGAADDGIAQAFQRTLAEKFGYNRPVVAPTTPLDLVTTGNRVGTSAVTNGGVWRTFVTGPVPLLGADVQNRAHYFRPADFASPRPLADGERLVGITYLPASERPDVADGGRDTFFVAAEGRPDAFGVLHTSGARVFLDGEMFARLAGGSELFQRALQGTGTVTLLADSTGAVDRPGFAARDFAQALAETAGYRRPVLAPHGEVTGDGQWRQPVITPGRRRP